MDGEILVAGNGFIQEEAWLRNEGFAVRVARNRKEALLLVQGVELVIIHSDFWPLAGMPLFQSLRDHPFNGPILFVSHIPEMDQVRAALRLGAADFLTLPVQQEVFLGVVQHFLSHWRLSQEHERRARNLVFAFRHVPEGLVVVDDQLTIRSINPEAMRLCAMLACRAPGMPFPGEDVCGQVCRLALLRVFGGENSKLPEQVTSCPRHGALAQVRVCPLPHEDGMARMGLLMIESVEKEVSLEEAALAEECVLIGDSRAMRHVRTMVGELADLDTTVLLTGESGTGKERVATALHRAGPRAKHPMLRVFCSGQSDLHLAGELLGLVPGAFPGAMEESDGAFMRANGGTLYLCEVGELSLSLQGRIARVVEEKRLTRLGDDEVFSVDTRIIAASRWNLRERLEQGALRPELYYRLKGVEIELPPLRQRKEDLPQLAHHFLARVNMGFGKQVMGLGKGVLDALYHYDWPGNLRELEHVLAQAALTCRGNEILVTDLPRELHLDREDGGEELRQVLGRTGGVKSQAARALGISRSTLYRRMRRMVGAQLE